MERQSRSNDESQLNDVLKEKEKKE